MTYDLAWLRSQTASRCVLVEAVASIAGVETTLYMSTTGYITEPGESPASKNYIPIIIGGIQVSEQISVEGSASLSYGDIEIQNINGKYDGWLDYVWVNRSVTVYIGDKRWPRADFQKVFDGIVSDIGAKSRDSLNIKIRDKLQRLNNPITDIVLGGSTTNKNALIPLTFGEVCNVTPLLTNPATLEYQVHYGPIEGVIEVRDNGVPITTYTTSLGTGKFTLTVAPAGVITCSVQGSKPSTYSNTISDIIQNIVLNYGKASTRFYTADLDTTNLSTYNTAHPQPVGIYISGRENIISIIQNLAYSLQSQVVIGRDGKLRLVQIDFPPAGTPTVITDTDIVLNSLKPVNKLEVKASVKLGYCRNWTIQENIQTGIPEEDKKLFANNYLTVTQNNGTIAAAYKLDAVAVQRDTYLLTSTDTITEASRELAICSAPRFIYTFEGLASCMLLELGQSLTLYNRRFGFVAGKTGIVTRLQPDWHTLRVIVEVMF